MKMSNNKEFSLREIYKGIVSKKLNESEEEEFDFEAAYAAAPQKIRDLLDDYGDDMDYDKLKVMRSKFNALGYDMNYGLDGQVTYFGPKGQ